MEAQYQISILSKKPLAWPYDKSGLITDSGHIQTTITTTIPESWMVTLDNDDNVIWYELKHDLANPLCPHTNKLGKCDLCLPNSNYCTSCGKLEHQGVCIETCPHNKPITENFQCDGCEYLLAEEKYINDIENHKCFNENCMPNNLCQGCQQTNYTETLCNLDTDENGEFDA